MPIACMFMLRPERAADVPANLGRATHAAVLELIAAADTSIAERIHKVERVKPLTVSNIRGLDPSGKTATVSPMRPYGLRVTLLNRALERIGASWTPASVPRLSLNGMTWRVERVTATPADHQWAGRETYEELIASALRRAEANPAHWTLEFVAPVTFRHLGRNQPLPTPNLVFGSLLDRWNAVSPFPFSEELRRFIADQIVVSRFDLRSAVETTKNGALQIGAVGCCTYTATSHEAYWIACIETLARFAFYGGVGAGTARGFGQVRLIERSSRVN